MDFFGIVTLFGGLALFLYGMNLMGGGLSQAAGGKLEILLEKLSSSKLKGMLLGTAVTAVIQSSSATTVMVVGFVNSGLMKLQNATGIIIGANLGATITPWILSLSSITGGSFFLQLMKPTTFAPILGVVGAYLFIFNKKESNKPIGSILLGFFILMTGMSVMSGSVTPLRDDPTFLSLLTAFSFPLLGIIVGAIVTAIIQSSAASIGILQALAISGSVTYGTAIPIIMGQNIGTCISAILSSMGARPNARRAAFIHLYFNIIKVIISAVLFYSINYFVRFSFMDNSITPISIAILHSLLNLFSVIIFYPFTSKLEWLALKTIKDEVPTEDEMALNKYIGELSHLDERFLNSPVVAVEQALSVTRVMSELTARSIRRALSLFEEYSDDIFNKVDKLEDAVDVYEDRVGNYLIKISQRQLAVEDSNKLSIILHSISDLERMSDHAINIAEELKIVNEKHENFSEACKKELKVFCGAVLEIVNLTEKVFETFDLELAKHVEPLEEVVDNITERSRRHHVRRMRDGECSMEMGVHFDNLINDLERISDHCSNIAVAIIELKEDVYDSHMYLDTLKATQSDDFQRMYKEYDEKFHL